jgi:hypothetical protein
LCSSQQQLEGAGPEKGKIYLAYFNYRRVEGALMSAIFKKTRNKRETTSRCVNDRMRLGHLDRYHFWMDSAPPRAIDRNGACRCH